SGGARESLGIGRAGGEHESAELLPDVASRGQAVAAGISESRDRGSHGAGRRKPDTRGQERGVWGGRGRAALWRPHDGGGGFGVDVASAISDDSDRRLCGTRAAAGVGGNLW